MKQFYFFIKFILNIIIKSNISIRFTLETLKIIYHYIKQSIK